jgi:hypothetical protein
MEAVVTRRISVSVVAGLVTFYFVTTGLLTFGAMAVIVPLRGFQALSASAP